MAVKWTDLAAVTTVQIADVLCLANSLDAFASSKKMTVAALNDITGNITQKVTGNRIIETTGTHTIQASGNYVKNVGNNNYIETITAATGEVVITTNDAYSITAAGTLTLASDGVVHLNNQNAFIDIQALGNMAFNTAGTIDVFSNLQIDITATNDLNVVAGGAATFRRAGGSFIKINGDDSMDVECNDNLDFAVTGDITGNAQNITWDASAVMTISGITSVEILSTGTGVFTIGTNLDFSVGADYSFVVNTNKYEMSVAGASGNTTIDVAGTYSVESTGNYDFRVNTSQYIKQVTAANGNTIETIAGTYDRVTTLNHTITVNTNKYIHAVVAASGNTSITVGGTLTEENTGAVARTNSSTVTETTTGRHRFTSTRMSMTGLPEFADNAAAAAGGLAVGDLYRQTATNFVSVVV